MITPTDTTIHATLFSDFKTKAGQRVVFLGWAEMLEAMDAMQTGTIRFGLWADNNMDSAPETLPGGTRVMFLNYGALPAWLLARLTKAHAYLVLDTAMLVLPVRADDYDRMASELRGALIKSWLLTVPLDDRAEERGGTVLFDSTCAVAAEHFSRNKGPKWERSAREPLLPQPKVQPTAAPVAAAQSPKRSFLVRLAAKTSSTSGRSPLVRLAAKASSTSGRSPLVATSRKAAGLPETGSLRNANVKVSKYAPPAPVKRNTTVSKFAPQATAPTVLAQPASSSASRTSAAAAPTTRPSGNAGHVAASAAALPVASGHVVATPLRAVPPLQTAASQSRPVSQTLQLPSRPAEWTAMVPSVALQPLALVLCGQCTLHGAELRHRDETIGRFHGTRVQLQELAGATAHRIMRVMLHYQYELNKGEIVGGVAALARLCGVQSARAKRSLQSLTLLELEQSRVLHVEEVRRGRAHVLRFELKGTFASGYFSTGRVKQSTKGRRIVPIPVTPPLTTSKDRAAHEMSLQLLLLAELRERGDRAKQFVSVDVNIGQLHRLSDLAGLSLARAEHWLRCCSETEGEVLVAEEVPSGWLVAVMAEVAPATYKAFYEGLHLTQTARLHRRGRRMTYKKRQKFLASHVRKK
jgi:hypothetical protein